MTNKKFENIFGDDVWGKAKAQGELMKDAISTFSAAYSDAVSKYNGRSWGDFANIFSISDGRGSGSFFGAEFTTKIFENFDLVAAKARLASSEIGDTEKKILQSLVDSYESYQEYIDNINSYLSSVFGEIGDSMMDSLFDNYDDLTTWADDVTGYISDSFKEMVKDIVYSMFFADKLKAAQDKIKAIMVDNNSADNASQITAVLTELNAGIVASGKDAVDFMTMMDEGWKKAMGESFFTKDGANTNSTASAIKGMDQPTADILTAQFSAIRINVASILAKIPDAATFLSINTNVSDILLSLQTQANSLQMVFADISAIKLNTDRLATIENYLWNVVNNGVKMK